MYVYPIDPLLCLYVKHYRFRSSFIITLVLDATCKVLRAAGVPELNIVLTYLEPTSPGMFPLHTPVINGND